MPGGPASLPPRTHRRRVDWLAVVGVAAAAVVVALLAWRSLGTTPQRAAGRSRPATNAPATTLDPELIHRILVEVDQGRLRVFHFDGTGEIDMTAPIPAGPARPVAVSDAIVFVADGEARAIVVPPMARPRHSVRLID